MSAPFGSHNRFKRWNEAWGCTTGFCYNQQTFFAFGGVKILNAGESARAHMNMKRRVGGKLNTYDLSILIAYDGDIALEVAGGLL